MPHPTKARMQTFRTAIITRTMRNKLIRTAIYLVRRIMQEIAQVVIIRNQRHHSHNLPAKEYSRSNQSKVKEMIIINMLLLKVYRIMSRASNNHSHNNNTNSLIIGVTNTQCRIKVIVDVLQYYRVIKTITTTTIRVQLHR